ncbi:MAG: activase, partial [Lachnospiraceae bacterium]|nr:activase [Lachnospiraceae bacterium]
MKYFGGCDSGSTYTKCVIIDETGKIVSDVTLRSRINSVLSCQDALDQAVAKVPDLNDPKDLTYLVGTGYGRNKVPFADENISEISCHAMGVHVADPSVKAIIDIGG